MYTATTVSGATPGADRQLVYIARPPPLRGSPSFLSLVSSISAIYKADYSRILYVPSHLVCLRLCTHMQLPQRLHAVADLSDITMRKWSMSKGCPLYEEIKLRKEEGRGRRPLNTGGAKLSEVRWPNVAARSIREQCAARALRGLFD
jgi:hypothetical protein